jgi:hypothetical protein
VFFETQLVSEGLVGRFHVLADALAFTKSGRFILENRPDRSVAQGVDFLLLSFTPKTLVANNALILVGINQ